MNRALELTQVQRISVWGCGNFECWWPGQLFGNRAAERKGKLEVHPWADGRPEKCRARRGAILRANWRDLFEQFARSPGAADVYVTIDLDCLRAEEAVTNWENGRFTVDDVLWALSILRQHRRIAGGDICGAYSPPVYARWKQRFVSELDHPKQKHPAVDESRRINFAVLEKLWPALTN
jgi:hypothetical protein